MQGGPPKHLLRGPPLCCASRKSLPPGDGKALGAAIAKRRPVRSWPRQLAYFAFEKERGGGGLVSLSSSDKSAGEEMGGFRQWRKYALDVLADRNVWMDTSSCM